MVVGYAADVGCSEESTRILGNEKSSAGRAAGIEERPSHVELVLYNVIIIGTLKNFGLALTHTPKGPGFIYDWFL